MHAEGARIVNVVRVQEQVEPSDAGNNVVAATSDTRNEYAKRMVPPEPVSTSTYHLLDGKKAKTTIYRRRSNSLE